MFIAKKSLLRISEMLFVFLRLVEITETEFISTTQKKEKKKFLRTVHLRSVNTKDNVNLYS